MNNPFDELNKRLDRIEAMLKESRLEGQHFRIGGIELAMEITGLSAQGIYKLVNKRKIPFLKPSGTRNLRFDEEKLKEWLESGHHKTEAEIIEETTLQKVT